MAALSTFRRLLGIGSILCVATLAATPAAGQTVHLLDGSLRLAGEASVTFGAKDDDAFFNYTDYERNALRTVYLAATALWQPRPRIAVVGEIRLDEFTDVTASAFYVRVRPSSRLPLDLQAGRIPPVFGLHGRLVYASDRLLIGYPLAYQYLTSLRAEAIPADAGDLLRMRGRGWLSSFPVGEPAAAAGLPLISGFRWDTGVQARWQSQHVEAAVALTQGTLANPKLVDDNGRPQISTRVALRPSPYLTLGVSAARGQLLSEDLPNRGRPGGDQASVGADAAFTRGRWLLRGEFVGTRWRLPYRITPPEGDNIDAIAAWVEGRYRLTPRLYVAARIDRLGFSQVTGRSPSERRDTWDAGVRRIEAGIGYSLMRNLIVRTSVQANDRDGGRVRRRTYLASQVAWWF